MEKLLNYLNSLTPAEQKAFANGCVTTVGYLRKACSRKQVLGTALSVAIERESGGVVTRRDLHPENWADQWPELAEALEAGA